MKDEKWFEWFWLDLDDAVDDETAVLRKDRAIEIIKRIYTQGRADQNEADDIGVLNELKYAKEHNENDLIHGLTLARYAIRAAGPEVGE